MLRRPIACAFLLWLLAACKTWYVREGISLQEIIATENPKAVRLWANGSYVVVEQPRFVGSDSLTGVHNGVSSNVAVADVAQVATQKVSAGNTIALVAGVSFAIGALSYAIFPCDVWDYCVVDVSADRLGGVN